jgi:glycosyltransferase involved in cell wall biosynthesis
MLPEVQKNRVPFLNVLFLSSGDRVPSARFRILPFIRRFRADGHRCVVAHSFPQKYDYFPWMGFRPSQLLKRSVRWWHWLRARLQRFDIVFIDREIFDTPSCAMEQRFRAACGRLVIDLDDAVFLRYPEKFAQLMEMSDLVVCGNRFLLERVQSLNPRTVLVPTCIEMDEYPAKDWNTHTAPHSVVGWIGTSGNVKYLSVAAEALRQVARVQPFELRVVAPDAAPLKELDLSGVQVVHDPWNPQREVEQIQRFDVGLMPLFPNQEWDIYKCGLKLIQYLAVGIPGIAAPVGVNSEILDNEQNGFAAETNAEWINALQRLIGNRDLQQSMGQRGRQTVIDRYSIQANYPVLRDALLGIL